MNKLNPCPFCGHEAMFELYIHPCGEDRYRVVCTNCAAMVDPGYAKDRLTVAEMWNERAVSV